ncbi:MAG: class I SAM-dependent methyltransferase, partial [Planctomycetota bacterium]
SITSGSRTRSSSLVVMDTEGEAREYDAMDHSGPNAAFVGRLIELGAQGRVLDIGCGPGQVAIEIAERIDGTHVVGIDLARHMLDVAQKRRARSEVEDRVSFELADAKGLPYPDHTFDVVCSNTILHHIPDPRPFLAEAGRVLKTNGVLLVRDLFRPRDAATVDALVSEHAADANPTQRELFRASLCAALTPSELEATAAEAGLEGVQVVVDTDRHMSLQRAAAR